MWGSEAKITLLDDFVTNTAPICYGILMPGEHDPNGVPVIKVKNIKSGSILCDDLLFTSKKIDNAYKRSKLKAGDILLTIRGSTGGIAIVPKELEGANITQDTARIRVKDGESSAYLFYALQSADVQRQVSLNTIGQAVKGINIAEVRKIRIHHPPLPEQTKIAQILSTWDKAIETVEKLITNSQQQKKALMQQLLTGKRRFPGFEGEWKTMLLEDMESEHLVTLSRGNVISRKDIENTPGDYPIYSSSVKNNGLFGIYGNYMFDEELITWSVDGGGDFFHRKRHKFSVTNVSGYMRVDPNHLNYKFVAGQLEFLHSKLEFDYQSKAHPSVIRKVYSISFPQLEEQQKVASVLSNADGDIEALQRKLCYLNQEKTALMQQLLTGRRRVTIDAEEVATA